MQPYQTIIGFRICDVWNNHVFDKSSLGLVSVINRGRRRRFVTLIKTFSTPVILKTKAMIILSYIVLKKPTDS